MWDPYSNFEKIILPNGLSLFASQVDRDFEIFGFIIHAGAREDVFEKSGIAHFVEHCVSENVSGWKKENIELHFQKQGGFADLGSTDYLKTYYTCKCQAVPKRIRETLQIFGEMLLNAKLSKNIELERDIIIQEYYLCHPYEVLRDIDLFVQKCVFPNHRLANFLRPLGDIDGIRNITKKNLQRFFDRFYVPANMSIVAVGKMPPQVVADFLMKSPFSQSKHGQRNALPAPRVPDYSAITRFDIKMSMLFGKENAMQHGTYKSYVALPGGISLEKMHFSKNLLGKMLFQEIREKRGWSYEIGTGYDSFQDLYKFEIEVPLKTDFLPHIEKLVDSCINKTISNKKLFKQVKELAINDPLIIDNSYSKICQNSMSDIGHFSRIIPMSETIRERKKISTKDVEEILSFLAPDKRLTVIAYP